MSKIPIVEQSVSSLHSNQKGITLPIVMVFMLLSQTIYWGVLHLNQINSQQYMQFQAYYQADIQNYMVDHLLTDDSSVFVATLESQLTAHLTQQHTFMLNSLAIDSWLLENPQVGLARLASGTDSERLFLYQQHVYLDQEQLEYCSLFQTLECFGQLNINGTYDPLIFEQQTVYTNEFDSLQSQLVAEGFLLNHTLKRNFLDQLVRSDFSEVYVQFNLGHVSIIQQNNRYYQITTQLRDFDFLLTQTIPFQTTRYLLIWHGYIYERPIEHEPTLLN